MSTCSRRRFLAASAGTLAAAATANAWARVLGANEKMRLAVIGINGRGGDLWNWAIGVPDVEIAIMCDPDERVLARQQRKLADKTGREAELVQDMRRVFDRRDIDAVLVATPNYWHALATIWACQAGKDVYCEKPVSHTPWEGRQMVAAARKYDRIVQAGLQNRSDTGLRAFLDWNRDGRLGRLKHVHTAWFRRRDPIGRVARPTDVPSEVDYDLFCGPRDLGPLMRKELHYDWHWQTPFGNGELGNNGVHMIDESRWMAGLGLPKRVLHVGERLLWDDDGDTPNVVMVVYDYGNLKLVAETRSLPETPGAKDAWKRHGRDMASCLYFESGMFAGSRGGGTAYDNEGNKIQDFKGDSGGGHMRNWLDAVRSRNRSSLITEIEEGRISTDLCHYGNIASRVALRQGYADVEKQLAGIDSAVEALGSIDEQMKGYGMDLRSRGIASSGWMTLDDEGRWFVAGNDAQSANGYMRDTYREPFVVREEV